MPLSLVDRLEQKRAELAQYQATSATVDPVALFRLAWGEPDEWQAETLTSTERRVMLNCARQSGKSTVTSTLAVAETHRKARALVLLLSPTLRQSSELFQKYMTVYRAAQDAGIALPSKYETKLTHELMNGSRVVSLPGKPDTIRGFSAVSLLIIDEAAFTSDLLYKGVRPMLAVSKGRLMLLSTPMGRRGFFYEEYSKRRSNWKYVEVPASKNPRIDEDFLREEREALGPLYAQEYECQFLDNETGMFDYDTIQRAIDAGELEDNWF